MKVVLLLLLAAIIMQSSCANYNRVPYGEIDPDGDEN